MLPITTTAPQQAEGLDPGITAARQRAQKRLRRRDSACGRWVMIANAAVGGRADHGRADPNEGWGATVFLQVIDPAAFAGLPGFERPVGKVARQCHAARPMDARRPVRLPGERGYPLAATHAERGLRLHEGIVPAIREWADKPLVALPVAMQPSRSAGPSPDRRRSALGRPRARSDRGSGSRWMGSAPARGYSAVITKSEYGAKESFG
ncbi:hypothetical protein [Xylophilus sp. GOD-11R]|uniref:hypothetical protein n=1 Tax=Xylophilus sp. GOD-11R TaxID=3089814 RepID=UPI00298CF9AC|nr:hypothetical protein [Xylophilus sp. GOD-11R]WPB55839.1 hypothetical protein R9X41_17040 [Xylophilus sp. GOD-11R]